MTQNCCAPECCESASPRDAKPVNAGSPSASIHEAVREHYAERARTGTSCCVSDALYAESLTSGLPPEIAGFSLGCGDPITLAGLQPGETVLDLGSGGGLDCFLAAQQIGPAGRVIGVDMTPEMLEKARANAARLNATNVEFRAGYLEDLPVEDASVDVVISNCVINLSPDKARVFREIFRVLRPGGRVAVSDIVTNGPLPEAVQTSRAAWGACIAGALDVNEYRKGMFEAGFTSVQVQPKGEADRALSAAGVPFSATVTALKSPAESLQVATPETVECAAPGGLESRRSDLEALMRRVAEITPVAGGYELRLAGEPAETRALAEAFIRDEASCCPFLHFELAEAAGGLRVRLTGSPSAMEFVQGAIQGPGAL